MLKYKHIFVLSSLLIFLCTIPFNASAFSFGSLFHVFQKDKPKPRPHVIAHAVDKREHIKVGVYVLHIGKYDFQSGTTQMDFYLIFKPNKPLKNINFEIMNAISANVNLVAHNKNYLIYRVQAALTNRGSLRNYPFDSHALDIVIEDRHLTTDKMVFETDPTISALDSDLSVIGFTVSTKWNATVSEHYYQVFQQKFSSYKFSMYIKRPFLAGVLKGIIPALIITCCSFLALFMKIDHMSQRVSIATSSLIAAVIFHLNLTSSLPPLGYVTFADMFMVINYLYLFIILIEVVITTYMLETKRRSFAIRINFICSWIFPSMWLICQVINWLTFNPMKVTG
jgi:hypothetical protein